MVAQALSEFPNECCGLLAGRIQPPTTRPASSDHSPLTTHHSPHIGQVERRYALVNAAASPVEFLSDPKSLFAAVRDMHLHEIDILAVYHSHPTSAAIPSRTDLERNYSPEVMNLIISLQNLQEPVIRGWWLSADQYFEAEWICVEDAGQG
jgi:[CysO sulfur-carrier protein]-S-L-cysteine hydrolase